MEYYWWGLILILPVLWFLLRRPKRKPSKLTLLYGPCDSGKTYLFYMVGPRQLTQNSSYETVSSMKVNEDQLLLPEVGAVTVKDIPGHQIFSADMQGDIADSQAVVFLVDSSDKSTFKEAAKLLYDLLKEARTTGKRLCLLVFCNKQDKPFSKKSLMVESELSTEL
jgi:signal recognition particle receptor subunit beta